MVDLYVLMNNAFGSLEKIRALIKEYKAAGPSRADALRLIAIKIDDYESDFDKLRRYMLSRKLNFQPFDSALIVFELYVQQESEFSRTLYRLTTHMNLDYREHHYSDIFE